MKKLFYIMSIVHTHCHFKLDFQKVDQHTEGKRLIHGTKHCKDNQLQSLWLPCRKSTIFYKFNKLKGIPHAGIISTYSEDPQPPMFM